MARVLFPTLKTSGAGISSASRAKRLTCTLSVTCLHTRHGNRSSFGISPIGTNPSVWIFTVGRPARNFRTARALSRLLFLLLTITPSSARSIGAHNLARASASVESSAKSCSLSRSALLGARYPVSGIQTHLSSVPVGAGIGIDRCAKSGRAPVSAAELFKGNLFSRVLADDAGNKRFSGYAMWLCKRAM
jgi:hypothetical protein